jgi:hypothetical protein
MYNLVMSGQDISCTGGVLTGSSLHKEELVHMRSTLPGRQWECGRSRSLQGAIILTGVVALLWIFAPCADAAVLPEKITGNTTLTAAGGPYTGQTTVESGATLTITKGVQLDIYSLNVKGTLKVEGTAEEPVVFADNVEPHFCSISFEAGSGASVIDHAEMSNGGYCGIGLVQVNGGSSPTIRNSTFIKSYYSAIKVNSGGAPEIANNQFLASRNTSISYKAASTQTGAINIHGNFIEGGANGIEVSIEGKPPVVGNSLGGNTIKNTTGKALYYSGTDIPGDIATNAASGNASNDLQVAGTVAHSAVWVSNGAPIRFIGPVAVSAGVSLSLNPGIYIRSPNMTINGTLKAEGSTLRPVVFTGLAESNGGEWGGIDLEAGSGASVLSYVEMGYGGSGRPMLNVKGVSPTIINSTFRRSSGDASRVQQSGHPTIEANRFRNNQYGLRYEGEGKLAAPRNDWGCANGPKPAGCGDSVSSNVDWQPAAILQELPRYCPGTVEPSTTAICLLQKYEPTLTLDSEENYLPDNAAEITDNWGDETGFAKEGTAGIFTNVLRDGETIASEASPWSYYGSYRLTLSALGPTYPGTYAADGNDWLDENNDYVRDAHWLEEAGYREAAYAHLSTDSSGKRWLEYWYWYYYNPKSFAINTGVHEGDWEAVLIGLDANNKPDTVIFSQHNQPSNCYFGDVEQTEEGAPIVYVAVDSHANYPRAGSFDAGFITDFADGEGAALQPGLVILGSSPPSWVNWPGHWGNSRGEFDSPTGPAFHSAWTDPAGYADGAAECSQTELEEFEEEFEVQASPYTASISSVATKNRRPTVGYHVPGARGNGYWPRLRISVDRLGDGGIPPVSRTISDVEAQGRVSIPMELASGETAEVLGSIVFSSGRRLHLAPKRVRMP